MTPQYIHINKHGDKFYYKDKEMNILHREDGPAIEFQDGYKVWYVNGKCHREDGPAIVFSNGDEAWYLNGLIHREDGPAIDEGGKYWYRNGVLHREDGPAIAFSNGTLRWYINGVQMSESEHARRTSKTVELTMDQIAKLAGVDVSKLKIIK